MKKVIRSVAMLAIMFVTAKSIAADPKLVTNSTDKSLTFSWESDSEVQSISIVDDAGNVIYSEVISGVTYSKKFDLNTLEEGSYTLKAKSNSKEIAYDVKIEKADLKVVEKKEVTKPFFRREDNKVFLNFLNLDKKDVTLEVTDNNNEIIFKETIKDEMIIEKAFSFEKAFANDYVISVRNNDNTFYESVVVK
ncbi:DUF3244 domain-containing protein [Maribacter halichondriae]|uniref:DUF3244 domain-containing protein n=1 Tax=Maribacter halichondriae TaxID=2980554 RepID=UPI00235A44C9|nr:DUF3244 domain-containing protein [Maribacter sp. Hal144]